MATIGKQSSGTTHYNGTNTTANAGGNGGASLVRCQLNKGIRSLLKSKSQTNYNRKTNKRQPLGEVNSNVSSTVLASREHHEQVRDGVDEYDL